MTQISGQRALSAALGVSQKTASKYINDTRWTLGPGPWTGKQIDQAKAWRRHHFPTEADEAPPPNASADPIAELRGLSIGRRAAITLVVERTAKLKLEREMLLGGYLKKDDVERGRVERIQAVRAELSNIRLLAIKMEGKTMQQREQILEEWARDVCRRFEDA